MLRLGSPVSSRTDGVRLNSKECRDLVSQPMNTRSVLTCASSFLLTQLLRHRSPLPLWAQAERGLPVPPGLPRGPLWLLPCPAPGHASQSCVPALQPCGVGRGVGGTLTSHCGNAAVRSPPAGHHILARWCFRKRELKPAGSQRGGCLHWAVAAFPPSSGGGFHVAGRTGTLVPLGQLSPEQPLPSPATLP